MPAPKAVLSDLLEFNMPAYKAHSRIACNGHLADDSRGGHRRHYEKKQQDEVTPDLPSVESSDPTAVPVVEVAQQPDVTVSDATTPTLESQDVPQSQPEDTTPVSDGVASSPDVESAPADDALDQTPTTEDDVEQEEASATTDDGSTLEVAVPDGGKKMMTKKPNVKGKKR